jgi:hypothetical protein
VIGAVSLGTAWLMTGARSRSGLGFGRVAIVTTFFDTGATVVLEWLNAELWRT